MCYDIICVIILNSQTYISVFSFLGENIEVLIKEDTYPN